MIFDYSNEAETRIKLQYYVLFLEEEENDK
jgi:hypothetical protein